MHSTIASRRPACRQRLLLSRSCTVRESWVCRIKEKNAPPSTLSRFALAVANLLAFVGPLYMGHGSVLHSANKTGFSCPALPWPLLAYCGFLRLLLLGSVGKRMAETNTIMSFTNNYNWEEAGLL